MTHRQTLEALSGLLLVLFVAMISSTIVSTALPKIIGALNGTPDPVHLGGHRDAAHRDRLHPDLGQARRPVQQEAADPGRDRASSSSARWSAASPRTPASSSPPARSRASASAACRRWSRSSIAAMIPPRERGRYNGYLGARDGRGHRRRPAARRPHRRHLLARLALVLLRRRAVRHRRCSVLQKTLHLPTVRRDQRQDRLPGRDPHRRRRQHPADLDLLRRQLVRLALLADRAPWSAAACCLLALAVLVESRVARAGRPAGHRPAAHHRPGHPRPASRSAWRCSAARSSSASTSRSAAATPRPRPACSPSR